MSRRGNGGEGGGGEGEEEGGGGAGETQGAEFIGTRLSWIMSNFRPYPATRFIIIVCVVQLEKYVIDPRCVRERKR